MHNRRRARVLLAVLVLTTLVMVTVDFRSGGAGGSDGPLGRLRDGVTVVFGPVQDGLATLVRPIGDAVGTVGDLFELRAENARLRARLDELTDRRRSFDDLARENDQLREMLAMRDREDYESVVARTVALGPSNFEWTIIIDAGADDGLARDMVVLNGDGLVGKVIQVTPRASRVLLAIDPNFAAAARIGGNGETGTVDGRGGQPMLFNPLENPEAQIEAGDEVVTSSYSSGVFPPGIPIGEVEDPGDPGSRLAREVTVRPFVDFTRLDHVLVILNSPVPDVPPLDDDGLEFVPPRSSPGPSPSPTGSPAPGPSPTEGQDPPDQPEDLAPEQTGDGDGGGDGGAGA